MMSWAQGAIGIVKKNDQRTTHAFWGGEEDGLVSMKWKACYGLQRGWMRTGDLGVRHADGYIQVKDRLKDIIISGLENISTIEVESVVYSHPAVLESAVVGRPDEYWGETPCAFVQLKDGASADAEEIIGFCRARLPDFMVPKSVVFGELPKTSTGKMQKFVLRERAKAMGSLFMNGGGKMLEI
ncbi:uncharacterized protein A4U43_UnF5150 [Asparagus officinalis]|uniref:AMP-binding enzyme C-terminal domain-containing protein n=1 Tax=Asparagus officinalis TaxID=4686 RepID=A0A1R3L6S1_ASPOF|nr:uncharacterized protein A4U43_UnF5150 [Asparagus officinalis]